MILEFSKKNGARKPLSVFALVMMNVIAVDSLRNLTIGAEYGLALVFFYLLAAALFFIPTILITAELATGWPITGGGYIWIREAFGSRYGFLSIWLQWIYNVVWYPTIFAFIAGVLAYLFDPNLVNNKFYMFSVILITFWGMTLINFFGIKTSSIVSAIGAILGTILPMVLIALLGVIWIFSGRPSQIHFSMGHLLPDHIDLLNLAFMTNILFSIMGMEMSAVHAEEVRHPAEDYPKALAYSSVIILVTLILASLAITIVVPLQQLNVVSGLIDSFGIFFTSFHLAWLLPLVAILIVIGGLSGAGAWIIGPAKGLLVASEEGDLPRFLRKRNHHNVPIGILLTQGVIVTFICLVFFIMPNVKSSYWLLSNLTAQLALIYYILLFAAAIRLHYKCAHVKRAFKIPGGSIGIWIVCGTGIATCFSAIILGFLPPTQIAVGQVSYYEVLLLLGIFLFCLPPFIIIGLTKK